MSHNVINYSELTGAAKVTKALSDVLEHLGPERYNLLVEGSRPERRGYIEGCLVNIAGISGFPVEAFLDTYCGPET